MDAFVETASKYAVQFGTKILGAIALWFVGGWLIKMALGLMTRSLTNRKLDPTVVQYSSSAMSVLLKILLIIAVLSIFGVETTTFAGVLAAAGVAIGMAWSGLLANFAAGIFMVVLRPIKVGDFVTVAGTTGTVAEIGLFVTAVDTMDNVRTVIGNGKVFGDTIMNFSHNDFRRVDLVAQLAHGVDPQEAIQLLKDAVGKIPNTVNTPDVHILEFNLAGPVLCVRPYTHTDTYWDVYFATNAAIAATLGGAGYPTPNKHYHIHGVGNAA